MKSILYLALIAAFSISTTQLAANELYTLKDAQAAMNNYFAKIESNEELDAKVMKTIKKDVEEAIIKAFKEITKNINTAELSTLLIKDPIEKILKSNGMYKSEILVLFFHLNLKYQLLKLTNLHQKKEKLKKYQSNQKLTKLVKNQQ